MLDIDVCPLLMGINRVISCFFMNKYDNFHFFIGKSDIFL